jgi:hypothetical protein
VLDRELAAGESAMVEYVSRRSSARRSICISAVIRNT